MNFNSYRDEQTFNEWISVRSRIGRSKRTPQSIKRKQAAKLAWKRGRHKMLSAIKRWHESPVGKRFHRTLGRFNKNKRGRVRECDNQILAPMVTLSLSEHMSWLMHQANYRLYEQVYYIQDVIGLISDDPDILEDILEDVR